MKRVGVVGNLGYGGIHAALRTIADLGPTLGLEPVFERALAEGSGIGTAADDFADVDVLISLGGDGTMLRGARAVGGRQIPLLGLNMGRLGFLTGAPANELPDALRRLASGEYTVETRMQIEARLVDHVGIDRAAYLALNDVVVHKAGLARLVALRVSADGQPIGTYAADGIIIATPTGSTAYSLSAGGPVVVPTLETLILTPVSAHTLAIRPVILPATAEVVVQVDDSPENLLVTVDGQAGASFGPGDRLLVRRAATGIQVVRFPGSSFFSTLRQKLGWGGLLERDEPAAC
jgi:NAD+ kinase